VFNLIDRGTSPIFQEQNGLSRVGRVVEISEKSPFLGYKTTETKSGAALLWQWKVTAPPEHAGKVASCFTNPPSETAPTTKNILGTILSGLAGKPLAAGDTFDPATTVGKPYMVVVSPGPKGGGLCVRTVVAAM